MVRLTKIYTRTGDAGQTRLVGGQQVDKDSARIEAYGTVDELNAILGMVRAAARERSALDAARRARLDAWLQETQQNLFNLGSDLATYIEDRWEGMPLVAAEDVVALERTIDEMNEELEPLKSFVLPGGGSVTALLHQARTVCRRAERRVLALARSEPIGEAVVPYVNRLSDALFVVSRWMAKHGDEPEILWAY